LGPSLLNSYEHPNGNQLNYDLIINQNLDSLLDSSHLAKVYIDNKNGTNGTLLASTCVSNVGLTGIGVECEYELRCSVCVINNASGKTIDIAANIPIIITCSKNQTIDYITNDVFMPILSALLEDLRFSKEGFGLLLLDWDRFRSEATSSDRMVTESSDHALVLLDMLDNFKSQLAVFLDYLSNPEKSKAKIFGWPKECMPFNLFLLETELLVRATPNLSHPPPAYDMLSSASAADDPPLLKLLKVSQNFLELAHKVCLSWVQPQNLENNDQISHGLENSFLEIGSILRLISGGADHETGEDYTKFQTQLQASIEFSA
jgi:hypothetical protein